MSWFRIDDKFHHHPKVVAAGNAAIGLFVRLGSWSAEHLSDGVVPDDVARSMGTRKDLRFLLTPSTLSGPLVVKVEGGILIPDFLEFNPSRESVLAERAATADRVRRYRSRNAVTTEVRNAVSTPSPSRPVPSPYLQSQSLSQSVEHEHALVRDALHAYAALQTTRRAHPSTAAAYERAIISNGVEHRDQLRSLVDAHPEFTAIEIARLYAGVEQEPPVMVAHHPEECDCESTGFVYADLDDPSKGVLACPAKW